MSTFDAVATELQRRVGNYESDSERIRAQRHHEVLCLVLKEYMRAWLNDKDYSLGVTHSACVVEARALADAAYPPPKEQS